MDPQTPNELGLRLREKFPGLNRLPLNNADLAEYILERHPTLIDLISPTARRVKEVADVSFRSQRWTEKGRLESEGIAISNQTAEIECIAPGFIDRTSA